MTTRSSTFSPRRAGAAAVLCLLACVAAGVAPAQAGPRAYALVGNALLPFDIDHPQIVGTPIPVTGLLDTEVLVGIDIRPINGHLYGVAIGPNGGTAQLYHIGTQTGVATRLGQSPFFVKDNGVTADDVVPGHFGVDFDPHRDELVVVNDAGQNFRLDPNDGHAVDGDFNAPGVNMHPRIAGIQPASVEAAAFTNNRGLASSTLLFTLSAAGNTLNMQDRFNNGYSGVQFEPVPVTLGGSVLDFTAVNGFDIPPGVIRSGFNFPRAVGSGIALLSVAPNGAPGVYRIDLQTGAATFTGALAGVTAPVRGLAVQGDPGALSGIAVRPPNGLVIFTTGVTGSSLTGTVSGLQANDMLVGVDWRPQTGQLYALTANPLSGLIRLYRIRPEALAATEVDFVAVGPQALVFNGPTRVFGFDFDPTTDLIRIVTTDGLNYRIDPNTARVVNAALDAFISSPQNLATPTAAAYTNSFAQRLGVGAPTTLYTLDPTTNSLWIQSPPNAGTLTHALPITLGGSPLDFSSATGFDIPGRVAVATAGAPASGLGYATLMVGGQARIYAIELDTGVATVVDGPFSSSPELDGLTVTEWPLTQTTVTVTSSANPSPIDHTVTLTATVTPAPTIGTIAFSIGGVAIAGCGTRPIAGGTASCATSFSTAGQIVVTAVYQGDDQRLPDAGTLTQTVTGLASSTSVSTSPNLAATGSTVTLLAQVAPAAASTQAPTGNVTFIVDGATVGVVALTNRQATLGIGTLAIGAHQVTATYGGDARFAASSGGPATVTIGVPGPLTQYFAEGAGGFFRTAIGLVNASATQAAHVSVWLYPEGAAPIELLMTLAPLGRQTLDLETVAGSAAGVSALITSDQPIAATRQMTWGDPVIGSTLESGIPSTSATWYFAEGATGPFSLYYLIQNPGASAVTVTLTHLTEGGGTPVVQQEIVPPFSRRTVSVHDVPGLAATSMSTAITATVPIVAERALYVSGPHLYEGGASSRGATSLQPTWSFAEGATGFFHTYLLLGNPHAEAATVTVRYLLPDATTLVRSYEVGGQSRRTIDVNGEDPLLASTAVGMSVQATRPIVAERAMWWGEPVWNEGSAALGSVETGYLWAIGEGAEGGPAQEATFVLIANASLTAGTIKVTVCYDDGTRQEREYALTGDARMTVRVGDDFAAARHHRFSVLVESLTDGMPITVDVSRYQSGDSFLGAGGAANATRIVR